MACSEEISKGEMLTEDRNGVEKYLQKLSAYGDR
jgi:hypothetical protein